MLALMFFDLHQSLETNKDRRTNIKIYIDAHIEDICPK